MSALKFMQTYRAELQFIATVSKSKSHLIIMSAKSIITRSLETPGIVT
jgi:hypothetical protein